MKIAIYQINPDRDENNVAFLNYENLERFQGSAELRSEIYDKVFEGEVECAETFFRCGSANRGVSFLLPRRRWQGRTE